MKVVCNREKLREGLAIANSVVPTKAPKPVLENVCLVATDDGLELLGTDLEVAVRYRISDVEVIEPGPVVLPARVAMDFVRDLASDSISLETRDGECLIEGGSDACELVTVDPDEFPVVSRFDSTSTLSVQGGSFSRLVGTTAFAAAREPGRYAMHGILTEVEGDLLRMVATDGRRLAVSNLPVDAGGLERPSAIIPTKGMQLFCRVIADPLDNLQIHFAENQVGVKTKNAEIFARLIDGEFPRYSAVVPQDIVYTMEADRETLTKKIRLVANVAGDEVRAVKLKLSKGKLELFGHSAGRGAATAHMDVEYDGQATEIAFKPDYVLDGLKNAESEIVRLEFNDRTSPGKFQLGENFIYVVMPITLET
jgi:DNA polymerase-3 subunit beta